MSVLSGCDWQARVVLGFVVALSAFLTIAPQAIHSIGFTGLAFHATVHNATYQPCSSVSAAELQAAVLKGVRARLNGSFDGPPFTLASLANLHPCMRRGADRSWSARRDVLYIVMGSSKILIVPAPCVQRGHKMLTMCLFMATFKTIRLE